MRQRKESDQFALAVSKKTRASASLSNEQNVVGSWPPSRKMNTIQPLVGAPPENSPTAGAEADAAGGVPNDAGALAVPVGSPPSETRSEAGGVETGAGVVDESCTPRRAESPGDVSCAASHPIRLSHIARSTPAW